MTLFDAHGLISTLITNQVVSQLQGPLFADTVQNLFLRGSFGDQIWFGENAESSSALEISLNSKGQDLLRRKVDVARNNGQDDGSFIGDITLHHRSHHRDVALGRDA